MLEKKQFLVVNDYGSGGVWGLVSATDEDQITARFPRLTVVDARPAWMTDEVFNTSVRINIADTDDPETPPWIG